MHLCRTARSETQRDAQADLPSTYLYLGMVWGYTIASQSKWYRKLLVHINHRILLLAQQARSRVESRGPRAHNGNADGKVEGSIAAQAARCRVKGRLDAKGRAACKPRCALSTDECAVQHGLSSPEDSQSESIFIGHAPRDRDIALPGRLSC